MTAEELIELPSGQHRYELIKGELLTMSPSGEEHGLLSATIASLLFTFVKANDLGVVYGSETGFKLESDPDTVLAPDVAFIRKARVGHRSKSYRNGPPDIAVEVISPSERKSQIECKIAQWLSFGTLSVWMVNPDSKAIEVVSVKGRNTFEENDYLVDEVIPGLLLRVSEIFD
jgi:Uma2 family endonuclease